MAEKAKGAQQPELPPPKNMVEKAADATVEFWQNLRIGDGHAAGMGRKGAVELGQYLPAFNNAGTSTVEDQGVFPNATQMEINQDKGVGGVDPEQQKSVLGYDLPEQQAGQEMQQQQSRGR